MTPKFLWRFVCGDFKEYPQLVSKMRELPRDILETRRAQLEKAESDENLSRDLLSRLVEARKSGEFSSDEELIDEILIFFVRYLLPKINYFQYSGHETTANTLSSAIQIIGDKPEVQRKLKDEADQFFENYSYEAIPSLKYTEAVIKETLRLMPTVPISGRYCVKPATLLGYNIQPGVSYHK
jgi:cytochrome P450